MGFLLQLAAHVALSGSSQALTQRDASLVIDAIALRAHEAATAIVDTSDPRHHTLTLFDSGNTQRARFAWDTSDSLLHYYDSTVDKDRSPNRGSLASPSPPSAARRRGEPARDALRHWRHSPHRVPMALHGSSHASRRLDPQRSVRIFVLVGVVIFVRARHPRPVAVQPPVELRGAVRRADEA